MSLTSIYINVFPMPLLVYFIQYINSALQYGIDFM